MNKEEKIRQPVPTALIHNVASPKVATHFGSPQGTLRSYHRYHSSHSYRWFWRRRQSQTRARNEPAAP